MKPEATWHPRTTAPWVCTFCGHHWPTTMLNQLHEPKCEMRVEEKA